MHHRGVVGVVLLQGCLLGANLDLPDAALVGDAVAVAPPPPEGGGLPQVRAGVEVVVEVETSSTVDVGASRFTLGGLQLACAPIGSTRRLRCAGTPEGTELEGRVRLNAELQGEEGRTSDATAEVAVFDFTPPTAGCVLTPRDATATSSILFSVVTSEALQGGPPSVVPSDERITATWQETIEGQHRYAVVGPVGVNIDGYALAVTGADLAGNPQVGASLCEAEATRGRFLGLGPRLLGEPAIVATPSVAPDGRPWARAGALVTVTLPTEGPIDPAASTVTLSGLPLEPSKDDTGAWTVTLDGSEGDGLKDLDARLVDPAGNPLRVQRPAVVRFDFTPPSATCTLSPTPAGAGAAITLSISPSEPLVTPPTFQSSTVDVSGTLVQEGARWVLPVQAPPDVDLDYTIDVAATDRVGNTAQGDALCPVADRTGRVLGVAPTLAAEPELSVVSGPTAVDDDGARRVGTGAVLEVRFDTLQPIDRARSSVQVGDLALAWDAPSSTWRRAVAAGDADGPKSVRMVLVDPVGNRTSLDRPAQRVLVDQTPPAATCLFTSQVAKAGDTIALEVFLSEAVAADAVAVDLPAPLTAVLPDTSAQVLRIGVVPPTTPVDVPSYVVGVAVEDLVGNRAADTALCPESERTGLYKGIGPAVTGEVLLDVTPSILRDGLPTATEGARVTVTLPTAEPLDPASSFVSMSGIALDSLDGVTWTVDLERVVGDGRKALTAVLVDPFGNLLVQEFPDIVFQADFTPPEVAATLLERVPWFARADDGAGTVRFNTLDPLTGVAVSAVLRVTSSEALGAVPTVEVAGPGALPFAALPPTGRIAAWRLPAIPTNQDGTYTFSVVLQDALGNVSAPVPLGVRMVIDTEAPPAPDVDTPDRVVYDRAPWGLDAAAVPAFLVRGSAGAATPTAQLQLRSPRGGLLSTGTADAAGGFTLVSAADEPEVLLRQADQAGNLSAPARVRDVRWTATMGGKRVGRTLENPHTFAALTRLDRQVTLPPATATAWASPSGSTRAALGWEQVPRYLGPTPGPRIASAMAYDAGRGVVVLFGGTDGDSFDGETWEWDGASWTQRTPPVSPPARQGHAMAYDLARGVTVLHGGFGFGVFGDTWEWDGTTWTERPGKTGQIGHAMTYDAERGVTIVVGGQFSDPATSETWEWDGTTWSPRSPATSPPRLDAPSFVYDPVHKVSVLFGGRVEGDVPQATTWLWNGDTWTDAQPVTAPSARFLATATYVEADGQVVLWGGCSQGNCGSASLTDAWAWNGSTWAPAPEHDLPEPRRNSLVAYDTRRAVAVWHGGRRDNESLPTATWEHSEGAWQERLPQAAPTDLSVPYMAYDAAREVSVVHGAASQVNLDSFHTETWEWDGSAWSPGDLGEDRVPTPRGDMAFTYDPIRQETLSFGGWAYDFFNDLWAWRDGAWSARVSDDQPTPRLGAAMAFHEAEGVAVLFGGLAEDFETLLDDTWLWNGEDWAPAEAGPRPPARRIQAMAYDPVREVVAMYGGAGGGQSVWEWDGQWSERVAGARPPQSDSAAMVYDPIRGALLLVGRGGDRSRIGTHTWDGQDWTEIPTAVTPTFRDAPGLSYDVARSQAVLFGGFDGTRLSDTWTLGSTSEERPAHRLDVSFAGAQAEEASVRAITLRWHAGATQAEGAAARSGVELLAWDRGDWRVVAISGASESAPEDLCWHLRAADAPAAPADCTSTTDDAWVARSLRFQDGRLGQFAVQPKHAFGSGVATVRSEDVSVEVRYRLP